jgi:mRNA interferase RelE/StbE
MVFGTARGGNATGLIITWHGGTGCESGSAEIVFEGVSAGGERKFLHVTLVSMRMLILPLTALMTGVQNTTQPKTRRSSLIFGIRWHEEAMDDLKKIDHRKQRKIIDRVKNYLSKDPFGLGKPLKGIFKGLYRYRCGPYRIIYAMDRESAIILILRIADGKDVYNDPIKGDQDS